MSLYEPQVQRVADALIEAGFDVEVLCMKHPDRPRIAVVDGVIITSLPASHRKGRRIRHALDYGWFYLLAGGILTSRHLRRPYALVQLYSMPDFLVFAAAVPKLLGARVVAYMNEPVPELFETIYGRGRLTRMLTVIEQLALRFADHAITVTEQLKSRYVERGASASRISVILNAADPARVLEGWSPPVADGEQGFTVVCHGTIEDRYGQDTILEAANLLRTSLPGVRFILLGKGSLANEIARRIEEQQLSDVVSFEGWVSNRRLNDVLATSNVGLIAQKASPYSHLVHTYKMFDYWMFGLPVLASRLKATAEVYGDGVIEYFEPGDPVSLAEAIRRLHNDPDRRRELSEEGTRALRSLGWSSQKAVLLDLYDHLLSDAA